MMKSEFENLAGRAVTNEQYRAIETLYMSSNLEKAEFVKSIRTMLKSIPQPERKKDIKRMVVRDKSGYRKTPNGCYYHIKYVELVDIDIKTGKYIIEAARRKANHISKQDKISWYNASVMLSYMGLFKHTDTYNYYIDYIKPKINVKKLKRIVSKHSRKENEHDRLEKGDRNTAGQAGGGRQDIVAVNGLPA